MKRFLLLGVCFLIFAIPAHASSDIEVKYLVNYSYDSAGNSHVIQNISLTNKTSNTYASHYQIILQGELPKNISGHDSLGPLKIVASQIKEDATQIDIDFNDVVVGLNKSLNFVLTYDGLRAQKRGQVWEITLPRLGENSQINDYTLKLNVPPEFGQPAFISPSPLTSQNRVYTFSKDQIAKVGVVAAFGNFQTFGFNLKYHLQNPTKTQGLTTIALPPDTNYQRVFYDSLDPMPKEVNVDPDGNWLATYIVAPNGELDITAAGQAHVLVEPSVPGLIPTPSQLNADLLPTQYWQVTDPTIQALAKKYNTPEKIYDYVVNSLDYNYARAGIGATRKGALEALKNPQDSICMEFTDVFIAIARAAGIPAREINGYAYTTDSYLRPLSLISNILHAWPEYWDSSKNAWVSVDPTWGKTTKGIDYFHKLDFSHFTFVIHGQSDSSPHPAGSYKIEFAPYKEYTPNPAKINWTKPLQIWSIIPTRTTISISNPQGQAIYKVPVQISTHSLLISSPYLHSIDILPPFGQKDLPLIFDRNLKPDFSPKNITITTGTSQITYNINEASFIFWHTILVTFISFIIIFLGFVTYKAWSLRL